MKKVLMLITPQIAEEWLEKNHCDQRKLQPRRVRQYALAMQRGEWGDTCDDIGISLTGYLVNGQHRLHAVVLSGCSIMAGVTFDMEEKSFVYIDCGQSRSTRQALRMVRDCSEKDSDILAAIIHSPEFIGGTAVDRGTIIRYFDRYEAALAQVREHQSSAVIKAVCTLAIDAGEDVASVKNFIRVYHTGLVDVKSDRIAVMLRNATQREHLTASSTGRKFLWRKSQRALRIFLDGTVVDKLYEASEDYWIAEKLED